MPYTGATFNLLTNDNYPAVEGEVIDPDPHNAMLEDLAAGLTAAVTRDGSGSMSGDLNMGSHKLTNLAAGSANGHSVRYEQVQLASAFATAWEGASWAADKMGYATSSSAVALIDTTSIGRALLNYADPNADRILFFDDSTGSITNLELGTGLSISTTTLNLSANLQTWSGVTPGTGVATALAINVGSTGAVVTSNSTDTLSNKTLSSPTLSGTVAGSVAASGVWNFGGGTGQSDAEIANRATGNNFEWGHTNTAGYGSTLGCDAGGGTPFVAFHGEAGSTSNTYRTRGIRASIFKPDASGGFIWANVSNASADNQSPSTLMTLSNAAVLAVNGSNVATEARTNSFTNDNIFSVAVGGGKAVYFEGGGGAGFRPYITADHSSPHEIMYVNLQGGTGGWSGRCIIRSNNSNGAFANQLDINNNAGTPYVEVTSGTIHGRATISSETSGTLTAASANKQINATGDITFNDGVFTAGDRGEIYAGASARSIVQDTGMTLRLDGTSTTGTRSLAARGRLSWYAVSNSEIVVSGMGVT